jgi:short-subunit dehydrogenase
MNVKDKVVVVSGAGNGIGREVALVLLEKGAKVVGLDLNAEALKETANLAAERAPHFKAIPLNITDRELVLALPKEVIKTFNQVDGLINVAGIIQPFVRINDLDFDTIERVVNVNFYGTLNLIKSFLPEFLKRPEAHIVNISSMGGFVPVPGQGIYGATKAAVKLMSEALVGELSTTNVGVSVVFPGAVSTNITANSGVEMKLPENMDTSKMKSLTPREAANLIVGAMETKAYHVYAGQDSKSMHLISRVSHKKASELISKQMQNLLQ